MKHRYRLAALGLVVVAVAVALLAQKAPWRDSRAVSPAEAAPSVRAPAVMGSFYPGSPLVLRDEIETDLDAASVKAAPGELVAIIVPHAGYQYSAPVAAYAYRVARGRRYETVAVVGPSHRFPFDGVALSSIPEWLTPLGRVEIDRAASEAISKAYPAARVLDAVHDPEHSIEVQLPFLQVVLGQFKLLPMLMSDFSDSNCQRLAQALAEWARDKPVLLVASSDMSHYPAYDDAVRVDRETLKAIETMDAAKVSATTKRLMSQGVPELSTCLCGEGPVKTVLMAAKLLGADRVQVLRYANSGDAPRGPRAGVVGYGAVAIYRSKPRPAASAQQDLTPEQQQRLLSLARDALEQYVRTGRVVDVTETDPALLRPGAAFVTLRKGGELRGCIGSLEPTQRLADDVRDRAIMAAARDPRFPPVRSDELAELEVEVSVLSPLRRVASAEEVDIYKHGVMVASGTRRGVYLPQVARETGWSRETLLTHLCQEKAGLPGDAWKNGAELYVFTVQAFSSPAPGAARNVGD